MAEFAIYRRKADAEMRPYVPGESLAQIAVPDTAAINGSPKPGDMVARRSDNHNDQWLVSKEDFEANYETLEGEPVGADEEPPRLFRKAHTEETSKSHKHK